MHATSLVENYLYGDNSTDSEVAQKVDGNRAKLK